MKKSWIFGITVITAASLLTGCGSNAAEITEKEIIKSVAAVELKEESHPLTLHYIGTVEPKETKKYSFKTSGKIAGIFVEEGRMVRKDDKLALLEQEEIHITELDVDKAQASYDFVKDYYEKIKKLHEKGAVSDQDLDEAELKMDQAKDSLEQVKKLLELARDGILITADSDGYVLNVISKKDEVVAAGYPVVVVSSAELKGRIGLTQEDVPKIKIGDEVDVFINDEAMKGTIAIINKIPDEESRTYMTDISINNDNEINIGAIIKVAIQAGREEGIWIPITCILNDGEDYVFVVEDGRAKRRNVKLKDIWEEKVSVEGLKEGEMLITEGIKSVKDGYQVSVDADLVKQ